MTSEMIEGRFDSAAAVRRVSGFPMTGWQFNWVVKIGGLRDRALVHSTFVDDSGDVDRQLGLNLLWTSRQFDREDAAAEIDPQNLNDAHAIALGDVGALITELDIAAAAESAARLDTETARIHALHDNRKAAAADKLAATRETLARLEASSIENERNVIPLWTANVERARAELDRVEDDRESALAELQRRLRPSSSYGLLSVARVIGDSERSRRGASAPGMVT